jgi:formylglycine-generating enzyme required for sulfatase activity
MLPGMRLLASLLILSLWIAGLETGDVAYAQLERLRKHKDIPAAPIPDPPMVSIPEGDFLMGANGMDALEDEKPQHRCGWIGTRSIRTR